MKKTLLTNSELANFTSQMALILQAGISPYEGISIMVEDSDNDKTKQFLSSIEELLNQGETLYTSLPVSYTHLPSYNSSFLSLQKTVYGNPKLEISFLLTSFPFSSYRRSS